MAKFDKIQVLQKMGETGMVPVFYHKDADIACAVVKACMMAAWAAATRAMGTRNGEQLT